MNILSKIGIFSLLGSLLLHFLLLMVTVSYVHTFSSPTNKSNNQHQIYPIRLYFYLPQKLNSSHEEKILEDNHLPLQAAHNMQSAYGASIQQKKTLPELKHPLQPSVDNEKYTNNHQLMNLVALLHSEIQLHQEYPREAQILNEEGVSTVGFNLQLDGEITNRHIIKSSGNKSIDDAALNAVKNASPITLNSENINFLKKNSPIFELKIAFNLG